MKTYFQLRAFKRLQGEFQQEFFCNLFGISLGGGKKKSNFNETEILDKTTEQELASTTVDTKEQTAVTKESGQTETEANIQALVESLASSTEQQSGSVAKTSAEETLSKVAAVSTDQTTGSSNALSTEQILANLQATTIAEGSNLSAVSALDKTTELGSINEATQSLDPETQALLQSLVGDLGEGGLQELISALTGSALNADAELAGITDPIVANLHANLEEALGQSKQGFARAAGGTTANTIVQQLGLQEGARVEREVADLAATLGLETRQLVTEEQSNAANITGDLLTQLTGLLKGSATTRKGETTTDAVRALEQLTTQQQTS